MIKIYLILFPKLVLLLMTFNVNAQNRNPEIEFYPMPSGYFIPNLSLIRPDIFVVPSKGGLFSPNKQQWIFKTNDTILSAEFSSISKSLLITTIQNGYYEILNSFHDSIHDRDTITPLLLTYNIIFNAKPSNFKKDMYYFIMGSDKYYLCSLFDKEIDTLFSADKMITDFKIIDTTTLLYCVQDKVMRYKLGEKPTIIFDALNQNIYGLTGDKNNLYFSLDSGIVKINRDQRSEYILGKGIKGKIQIFNNRIYVLDSDDRKLYSVALE
ncbi:MAG: hypothetical protein IPP27_02250 [Bacteroidetes bacterium]|nr:hypothetical protein [Bacteroidota bacterium]